MTAAPACPCIARPAVRAVRSPAGEPGEGSRRGLGLGLSIVRGFAEAMGATVRAEASPLGGLRIVVSLPIAAASRRRGRRSAVGTATRARRLSGPHLLLVEDDEATRSSVAANLAAHGLPGQRGRRRRRRRSVSGMPGDRT